MYLNKVFVFGNVSRDLELKTLPYRSKAWSIALAARRFGKAKEGQAQLVSH